MCIDCDKVKRDIAMLQEWLNVSTCKQIPARRRYWREYYQRNRDKKLAAANARYSAVRDKLTIPAEADNNSQDERSVR